MTDIFGPEGEFWEMSESKMYFDFIGEQTYILHRCLRSNRVLCRVRARCSDHRHKLSLRRRNVAQSDQTDEGSVGARRLQQHISHDAAARLLDERLQ